MAPLTAVRELRAQGAIRESDTVVVLMTATGLKDPDATATHASAIPVVGNDLGEFLGALRSAYGFTF